MNYNIFSSSISAINGIFPLTSKSSIEIEAFMLQYRLKDLGLYTKGLDGKVGPGTLSGVENFFKLFPTPSLNTKTEITKNDFDKILSFAFEKSSIAPNPFTTQKVDELATNVGKCAINLGICLEAIAKNNPKKSVKKTDTQRFEFAITELIDKYNQVANRFNGCWTKKSMFGDIVYQNQTNTNVNAWAQPYKNKIIIPAAGTDKNDIRYGITAEGTWKGLWRDVNELVNHTFYVSEFFAAFYSISTPQNANNMADNTNNNNTNTTAPSIDLFGNGQQQSDKSGTTQKTNADAGQILDQVFNLMVVGGVFYVGVTLFKDFRKENKR